MSKTLKLLLVDNYDSFTFNLKHLIEGQPETALTVCRNDDDFLPDIQKGVFDGAIISPGPGTPEDDAYFGNNKRLILDYGTKGLPILGVCLGFQGIYHCFGGKLKLGDKPVHGKTSRLGIKEEGCFLKSVPNGTVVMRYHSILADTEEGVPADINITAYTLDEEGRLNTNNPMALEHKQFPLYGVQFHPESFATQNADVMIKNYLDACRKNRRD